MADTILRTFPEDEAEALAMLYVQNQDLSGITPEQLFDMYEDTCKKIKEYRKDKHNAARQKIYF